MKHIELDENKSILGLKRQQRVIRDELLLFLFSRQFRGHGHFEAVVSSWKRLLTV